MAEQSEAGLPSTKQRIAKRLRELRDQLKLTQAEVAKRAGLGRSAVVNYENEKAVPGGLELIKLARALETTPNFILSGSERFRESKEPEHLLATGDNAELITKVGICLLMLEPDVRESLSAFLMALAKERTSSENYEALMQTIEAMVPLVGQMTPDAEALVERAVEDNWDELEKKLGPAATGDGGEA